MIPVFMGDLSFVCVSMFFVLVKFCQIWPGTLGLDSVQEFFMAKISEIHDILKQEIFWNLEILWGGQDYKRNLIISTFMYSM